MNGREGHSCYSRDLPRTAKSTYSHFRYLSSNYILYFTHIRKFALLTATHLGIIIFSLGPTIYFQPILPRPRTGIEAPQHMAGIGRQGVYKSIHTYAIEFCLWVGAGSPCCYFIRRLLGRCGGSSGQHDAEVDVWWIRFISFQGVDGRIDYIICLVPFYS